MLISKVKGIRVIHFSGEQTYVDGDFHVERALGVIEVTGARLGIRTPSLRIGFTNSGPPARPTFTTDEHQALGSMTLPSIHFAAFLALASLPSAYFRIGNPPENNALASESTILRFADRPRR